MVKKKQPYESPEITATRVELESSICAGSVDIANPNDVNGKIESQKVNTDFGYNYSNNEWEIGDSSTN